MKTETKEIKLRLELGLDQALTVAAKKAGIPKTKLAMQLLSQGLLGSPSVVDVNSDRITGAEAERILFKCEVKCLCTGEKLTWFDSYLWIVGKSANGYQAVLSKLMEYPKPLFEGLLRAYYPRNSKDALRDALANWNELKALDGIELLDTYWFEDGDYFFTHDSNNSYKDYSKHKERTLEGIAEAKAALEAIAESKTALDVVADETPIEVVNVPSSPYVEQVVDTRPLVESTQLSLLELPETLTKAEFKTRHNLTDVEYAIVGRVGASGWTAEDGSTWFASGTAKLRVWSNCPVATPKAETKVLSIV